MNISGKRSYHIKRKKSPYSGALNVWLLHKLVC